jgi:hypothetical protein
MDNEYLDAFKLFQKQQDKINKILRNPAIEAIQRQQDSMNRLIGNSATMGLNSYQGVASITNNSAFRELQRQQETWNRLIGNSATLGLKKYQSVASVMHGRAFDNLVKHQKAINGIVRNSAFEAIQKYQDTWSRLVGKSVFAGLEQYHGITSVMNNLAFDNYQIGITQVMKSSTFDVLQKHQDRWNDLIKKISDLGINSNTFSEVVEELQEVYDDIDSSTSVTEDESNNDQEFKKVIQGIISYCMQVAQVFHVVDTKVIWGVLEKVSVIITILSIVNVEEPTKQENNVQILNVNGDYNTINIENSDSGTIIINTDDKETEVKIKESKVTDQEELNNKNEEFDEDCEFDISAGLKV